MLLKHIRVTGNLQICMNYHKRKYMKAAFRDWHFIRVMAEFLDVYWVPLNHISLSQAEFKFCTICEVVPRGTLLTSRLSALLTMGR